MVKWEIDADYSHIFVIRTFAVHPYFMKKGIGKALPIITSKWHKTRESISLDVYEKNFPAISLYNKYGFEYIATVDTGLGSYGLVQTV